MFVSCFVCLHTYVYICIYVSTQNTLISLIVFQQLCGCIPRLYPIVGLLVFCVDSIGFCYYPIQVVGRISIGAYRLVRNVLIIVSTKFVLKASTASGGVLHL